MGDGLSGNKVIRRMVFMRENEGEFFLPPPLSTYKYGIDSDQTPHTGTIKHATAAKVAIFTSALDIAQIEGEGTVLIKNTDETLNLMSG